MEYSALAIGLTDKLFSSLQSLTSHNLRFTPSLTVQDASRLLIQQVFHLLIVDLKYLRSIQQIEWLASVRRITFVPIIVLSDTPEYDLHPMIQLGADICISNEQAPPLIADLVFSQLRRYTEYNHYDDPENAETASFKAGDIFIDPPRHMVQVRGQPVNLRPREFSLLLYFMRNINIVLTAEQICENAWGMEGSYNYGVSGPIAILRKAIEPDTAHPKYIETVSHIGYRFTAYHSETCDDYSDSEVIL